MKSIKTFILFLFTIVVINSCKTDDSVIDSNSPNNIKILNTSQWTVKAKHYQRVLQGVLGGGFTTQAFSLQKSDELRWYLWFKHMNGYQHPTEIVLNNQNNVSVNTSTNNMSSDFREMKTIFGSDVWEAHVNFDTASAVHVFKNGEEIKIGSPYFGFKKTQPSEDGILNNETNNGTNLISHFNFQTGEWKNNAVWATDYVSARYRNKTYAVSLSNNENTNGKAKIFAYIEAETETSAGNHNMILKNSVEINHSGMIMHSQVHGDNLFLAIRANSQKQYVVYKINLNDYSVQNVLAETIVENFSNYDYLVKYLYSNVAIDPIGNLYLIANRSENHNPKFSIRKYNTTGGSELILKEEDLINNAQLQAIFYFNNTLHAAIMYREELANESNPDKDSWVSNYHMQIISKN